MDFGFYLPTRGSLGTPENISSLARKGEDLGFSYLAIADHIVVPKSVSSTYPYTDGGDWPAGRDGDFLEQLSILAYLAGQTNSVRLLSSVMVLPHRPPVLTAKILATIDVLSRGRLTVGAGAGWCEEEFAALGTPPHSQRGRVADEYISVFRELWKNNNPKFIGDYANFSDIIFEPKPIQIHGPPIWIGGEGNAALKRVARVGDGWYPIAHNPKFPLDTIDRYKSKLNILNGFMDKSERILEELDLGLFIMLWGSKPGKMLLPIGKKGPSTDRNRRLMSGSAQQMVEDVQSLRELGVKTLNLNFEAETLEETCDCMERFACEVIGPSTH